MSNKINKVFHPSFYLKEYIEELQMTQDEFAKRLGISGKQISLILNESASITVDIAYKLSKLIGTSVELWLNLQNKYDLYLMELKAKELLEEEKKIYKMIDKKFLVKLNIIDENDKIDVAIDKLRRASQVSSLTLHTKNDIYCYYRTSINKEENIENIVCRNVWVSIASSIAKKEELREFNEEKLIKYIDDFRKLTLESPEVFYPKIKSMLNECGVMLVLLPSLKNSNINGVVKWLENDKVMMALNTRGSFNDKFWFSFFHELKHILQKTKRKMIINEDNFSVDCINEYEADLFAKEVLIPSDLLNTLKVYNHLAIVDFANKIGIHPGIVVGRLQKDNKIKYSEFNYLKEKYEIIV